MTFNKNTSLFSIFAKIIKIMTNIEISIERTNSPSVLKFVNPKITTIGSYEYQNIDDAKNSPIAQKLFHFPFIKSVLISQNYIALEKHANIEWFDVHDDLKSLIKTYVKNNNSFIMEQNTKKIPVEIYSEVTPNPSVLKFVANKMLTNVDAELKNIDEATKAPIALELFKFPFVKEVYISDNYISITKYENADWNEIMIEIKDFIKNYISDGKKIIDNDYQLPNQLKKESSIGSLDDISKQIIQILDEYVRPAVAGDGGNIQFVSYEEDTQNVNVILQGACSGCPSSTMTLKNGIENILKQLIPNKINNVTAING